MIDVVQARDAKKLLRDGWCDEDVERLTGLSLPGIVLMRAEAAAAADHVHRQVTSPGAPRQPRV